MWIFYPRPARKLIDQLILLGGPPTVVSVNSGPSRSEFGGPIEAGADKTERDTGLRSPT